MLRVRSGQHPAPVNLSVPSYWPSQWEDKAGSTLSPPCSHASHRLPGTRHREPLPTTPPLKSGLSFPSGLSLFLRRKRKVKIKIREDSVVPEAWYKLVNTHLVISDKQAL